MPLKIHFLALTSLASAALASSSLAAPGNIALGQPYSAEPRLGGYPNTENGAEATKLTDGKFAKTRLWNDLQHTVGWRAGRWNIHLTVDLGERKPISGMALSTAAGVATDSKEIFIWPGLIDIFVSDDSKQWYHAGELTSLNDAENEPLPPFANQYEARRISTTGLRTHGRYVRFVVSSRREFLLDEVEVFKGDDAWLAEERKGPATATVKLDEAVVRRDATLFVTQRRYRLDIAAIKRQLDTLKPKLAAPIRKELESLREKVEALHEQPEDKRAIIPSGPLGQQILAQQAEVWRAQGYPAITVWKSSHWDQLAWLTPPPKTKQEPHLALRLMGGERRSESLQISNASPAPARYKVAFEGFPEGAAPTVTIHQVEWTEDVMRSPISHALPDAADGTITIPSGLTREVFLNVRAPEKNGTHQGKVTLTPLEEDGSLPAFSIPFTVTVSPLSLPAAQSLNVGGWDYLNSLSIKRYGFTPENSTSARKVLLDYGMNTPWANLAVLPKGTFDANHEYASPTDEPDTAAFDHWVKEVWPNAKRYHLFLSADNKEHRSVIMGVDHAEQPEAFNKRVSTWLRFWSAHVKKLGLDPDRFSVQILDEPGIHQNNPFVNDRQLRVWAEAIRKADTGFRIWLDPIYFEPWKADQGMLDMHDELCVKYAHLIVHGQRYRDYYQARGQRQQLYLYECYPIAGFDPYSYHRLQAWMAWEMGAGGSSFWAFGDSGRAASFGSWNNGLNQLRYSPLFFDEKTTVPGKAMVAIHESASDFEYLTMLRDAVANAEKAGQSGPKLEAAKELLTTGPRRVLWETGALKEPKWLLVNPIDRTTADTVRLEILDALESLQETPNP